VDLEVKMLRGCCCGLGGEDIERVLLWLCLHASFGYGFLGRRVTKKCICASYGLEREIMRVFSIENKCRAF